MPVMDRLKLIGLDEADLDVISAHMQDAVFKVGDIDYLKRNRQFVLSGNRFVWEKAGTGRARSFERRRTVLHFGRVGRVRTIGIDRRRADDVLSLLSIRFDPDPVPPSGEIELIFAGDASIVLDVECIEAQLADQGGAWETRFRPKHPLPD